MSTCHFINFSGFKRGFMMMMIMNRLRLGHTFITHEYTTTSMPKTIYLYANRVKYLAFIVKHIIISCRKYDES